MISDPQFCFKKFSGKGGVLTWHVSKAEPEQGKIQKFWLVLSSD